MKKIDKRHQVLVDFWHVAPKKISLKHKGKQAIYTKKKCHYKPDYYIFLVLVSL